MSFQYSLRGLILLLTIAAILLGWSRWYADKRATAKRNGDMIRQQYVSADDVFQQPKSQSWRNKHVGPGTTCNGRVHGGHDGQSWNLTIEQWFALKEVGEPDIHIEVGTRVIGDVVLPIEIRDFGAKHNHVIVEQLTRAFRARDWNSTRVVVATKADARP